MRLPMRGANRPDSFDFPKIKVLVDAFPAQGFSYFDTTFITAMRDSADFVMGSHFRERIEPGAMPPLHRYFGTPLTTWILSP